MASQFQADAYTALQTREIHAPTQEELTALWAEIARRLQAPTAPAPHLAGGGVVLSTCPAPAFPAPVLLGGCTPPAPPPPAWPRSTEAPAACKGEERAAAAFSHSRSTSSGSTASTACSTGSCMSQEEEEEPLHADDVDSGEHAHRGRPQEHQTEWLPCDSERGDIAAHWRHLVKNTFIEVRTARSPSLNGFFRERLVRSCPASRSASIDNASPTYVGSGRVGEAPKAGEVAVAEASPESANHRAAGEGKTALQVVRLFEATTPPVLRLAEALHLPEAEASLPSEGSEGHYAGTCKPCAFVHTKGCSSGKDCKFCHLCTAGARRTRKREMRRLARGVLHENIGVA
mmetsp:Transcript_127411/g.354665  ORF Transcript_127411/g.354665 Transcript_127411/m.354665 type:complete len:345 (-) Transcript_127411:188-1222(-)